MCFPPIDQANPFEYSGSFALHTSYKNGMLDQRGKAVKMLKKQIIKLISHQFCTSL